MLSDIRFLVDESGLEGIDGDVESTFALLTSRIAKCRSCGVAKFSYLWDMLVQGRPLHEWLFSHELSLDRDVARALQTALDRSPNWDEMVELQCAPTDIEHCGQTRTAYSLAAAATSLVQHGHGMGAISPLELALGPSEVGIRVDQDLKCACIHFVGDDLSLLSFFRHLPEVEDLSEDGYFENARHAFPILRFHLQRTRFSAFDEDYRTVRAKVTKHLGVLNDHAVKIFATAKDPRIIVSELAVLGVDASGESGNTKANASAMKQRYIVTDWGAMVLEWHTKIRPNRDRIYFGLAPPLVIVGIFHRHLD